MALSLQVQLISSFQDELKYSIKNDSLGEIASKFFYLEPTTGVVTIRRALNRTDPEFPANAQFLFAIIATDQVPINQKSTEASVSIRVTTGGDRPPVFDLSLYNTEIDENYGINSTVINTRAVDPDNNGGQVRYDLFSRTSELQPFDIDSVTGTVYVRDSLKGQNIFGSVYRYVLFFTCSS